ncbi:MAG: aspartate-semialdehyde dehydrogenase, partial [Flavobacterium sp.]
DLNVIPQIDVFTENGYTKEEMKMINETRKIMGDDSIRLTATTVRIPVMGGHSESVNIEFESDFDIVEVTSLLAKTPGIIVVDDIANAKYPMPKDAHEKDEVFVGRIRRDESMPNTLNMWIVADNLRKGAATNAVQIAEYLLQNELV